MTGDVERLNDAAYEAFTRLRPLLREFYALEGRIPDGHGGDVVDTARRSRRLMGRLRDVLPEWADARRSLCNALWLEDAAAFRDFRQRAAAGDFGAFGYFVFL